MKMKSIRSGGFCVQSVFRKLERVVLVFKKKQKKIERQWQVVDENLFPEYLFIDIDQPENMYKELKRTPKPKLLFSDDVYISTLEQHKADLVGTLADKSEIIGISGVQVAGDGMIWYLSGPLVR